MNIGNATMLYIQYIYGVSMDRFIAHNNITIHIYNDISRIYCLKNQSN